MVLLEPHSPGPFRSKKPHRKVIWFVRFHLGQVGPPSRSYRSLLPPPRAIYAAGLAITSSAGPGYPNFLADRANRSDVIGLMPDQEQDRLQRCFFAISSLFRH